MSKVFLYVYLNNNFGDDLFVDIIARRYPQTTFYVLCSDSGRKTIKNANVRPVVENWFYRGINKVSKILTKKRAANIFLVKMCDISVYLGGSLFIEDATWKERFGVLDELACYSEQFCVIGANYGPYETEEYENTYRRFFAGLSDVCFRDGYSYQMFKGEGAHIRKAPDVAFCYRSKVDVKPEKTVSVICISAEGRTDLNVDADTHVQQQVRLCEGFVKRGYEINLISFCEPQGDLKTCCRIYEGLSADAKAFVRINRYFGNLNEIMELLGKSEIILAGRFHGMIMGWLLGRNTVPVIYSDKMKHVIEDMQYTGLFYDLRKEMEYCVEDIINNIHIRPEKLEEYVKAADQQFQYLDKVLGKGRKE